MDMGYAMEVVTLYVVTFAVVVGYIVQIVSETIKYRFNCTTVQV